jgi:putative SOS response-associated peptidase YedK
MCGRYAIKILALRSLEEYFALENLKDVQDSYNVAPTHAVPIVRMKDGRPEASMVRWGLVPAFCKGVAPAYSTINARIETMETAAAYRGPWQRSQRCLQFASGFYEWHASASGRKNPYYITCADQDVFAFAALWDRSVRADGTVVESCAHITMPANELMRDIHNAGSHPHRMPAILRREDHETWLKGSLAQARAVLEPYPASLMVAHSVSSKVNSPKNDSPDLIEPVVLDAELF